jgi:hypothetical protein
MGGHAVPPRDAGRAAGERHGAADLRTDGLPHRRRVHGLAARSLTTAAAAELRAGLDMQVPPALRVGELPGHALRG